jgi:hypothetical protein
MDMCEHNNIMQSAHLGDPYGVHSQIKEQRCTFKTLWKNWGFAIGLAITRTTCKSTWKYGVNCIKWVALVTTNMTCAFGVAGYHI